MSPFKLLELFLYCKCIIYSLQFQNMRNLFGFFKYVFFMEFKKEDNVWRLLMSKGSSFHILIAEGIKLSK